MLETSETHLLIVNEGFSINVTQIPEPSTTLLLALGVVGMVGVRRLLT